MKKYLEVLDFAVGQFYIINQERFCAPFSRYYKPAPDETVCEFKEYDNKPEIDTSLVSDIDDAYGYLILWDMQLNRVLLYPCMTEEEIGNDKFVSDVSIKYFGHNVEAYMFSLEPIRIIRIEND